MNNDKLLLITMIGMEQLVVLILAAKIGSVRGLLAFLGGVLIALNIIYFQAYLMKMQLGASY